MTDHELTPEQRARAAELAAVFEADVRVKLQSGPISPAELKKMLIDSAATLDPRPAPPEVIVHDNGRIEVLAPLSWFNRD